MRRISPAFALAALLLAPSSALANQHQMRVNEVLLSSGGNDAVQFVELKDASEDLPNTYFLGIYDADGASLGTVSLPDPDPLTPGTILISTTEADAELGTEGEVELTVALPEAGQVCFEVVPSTKISCVSWGCINTVVSGTYDTGEGASPPDGQSLQRQTNGTYNLGNPTPDAANEAGTPATACPGAPDAGPGGIDAGEGEADAAPVGDDGGTNGGDGSGDDDDDSGCGCRVDVARLSSGGFSFAAVLVLAAFRRRRRSS